MKFEQFNFDVPSFLLSALINGDESGLQDSDIFMLSEWLESEKKLFSSGHWSYNEEELEGNFMKYHDLSNYFLACECIKLTWNKPLS